MTKINLAFHNDPSLAARVRSQVDAHTAADEIIQGTYWENGKGCFIGCIAHGRDVNVVEELTGFPPMLIRIAEGIFEGLPNEDAKAFPQAIVNAPSVGADISLVVWKFLYWFVDDVLTAHATPDVKNGCTDALSVLKDRAGGIYVDEKRAYDAAYAAYAVYAAAYADAAYAAAYAAYAAAYADAADAAYAAYAADVAYAVRAAAYAADAAAYAATYDVAYARKRHAAKLIELLQNAKGTVNEMEACAG